jgi:hypothetical protein
MKRFELTDKKAIINFDAVHCESEAKLLQSRSFSLVLAQYLRHLRKKKDPLVQSLKGIKSSMILDSYKHLLVYDYHDVYKKNENLHPLLKHRDVFYRFSESFYDYWRKIERYAFMLRPKQSGHDIGRQSLIQTSDHLNQLVLSVYRSVTQKILGSEFSVYRQLPAGLNANLFLVPNRWTTKKMFEPLQNANFIASLLVRPPFMIYSKANTRSGLFKEGKKHPLKHIKFDKSNYFVYPIMVGPCLTYVYFHKTFLHHGVALCNLFEPAHYEQFKDKKPDIIYLCGIEEAEFDATYFYDQEEDIYIGTLELKDTNDYFGYMKKMLLTMHNVYMIDRGHLPIHGAMVNCTLKNGKEKNIVVIGDSGAGKSETLEALRVIGSQYIKSMRVIYDDMGTFMIKNNNMVSFGTEIGAFVRLDDLDSGYAYQEFDRAVFLNPDKTNARLILPVSEYHFVMHEHHVDIVLYANNYDTK